MEQTKKKANKFAIGLLFIVSIAFGFVQERVKVNINFILEKSSTIPNFYTLSSEDREQALSNLKQKGNFDYYYSHESISFLYTLSQPSLNKLKWIVTAASVLFFFLINYFILKLFNATATHFQIFKILTGTILILAIFSQLLGTLLNLSKDFYPITRGLMGILQSSISVIILILAFKFIGNGDEKSNT